MDANKASLADLRLEASLGVKDERPLLGSARSGYTDPSSIWTMLIWYTAYDTADRRPPTGGDRLLNYIMN